MVPRNTFYQPVNKRSKAAMRAFLTQHFRYFTGNSWNVSSSYACNMKLYHLGLPRELEDKLWDMLEVEEFYDPINQLRNQFAEEHDDQWQAAFNGRSGGYLVLYQGGRKPTGHKSYCTCCGQRNFTSVTETNNVCGRCGQHTRVDYTRPPMEVYAYPMRGVDSGEDYEDWSLSELRERTALVQEFDRLADAIVSAGIKAAGYYLPLSEKVTVDMAGHWRKDPKYGLQFEMESYEEVVESGRKGMIAYLSSGLIKGIGPKLAGRIYDTFGEDTLNILDRDPTRINEVPGVGAGKCARFAKAYTETRGARKIINLLAPLDVSAAQSIHLWKELGLDAEGILRRQPYDVFEQDLISFELAERLAERNDIPRTAPERVDAALLYTLRLAEQKGHICLHKECFIQEAVRILATASLNRMAVAERAFEMLKEKRLALYQDHVYRPVFADAEQGTAAYIQEMLSRTQLPYMGDLDEELDRQEELLGLTLAEEQRHAVKTALAYPLSIITGGPGTGFFASTVHKALGLTSGEHNSEDAEPPQITMADLVLVDEVSMLDMMLAWYLIRMLPLNCRLILIGDADQLPSVGPGAVFSELLACGKIPQVRLDRVFRQDEGSRIAENAKLIRHGRTDLDYGDDFQFWSSPDMEQSASCLEQLYIREVQKYGIDNVVLLTPFRKKTATGAQTLNKSIQARINPPAPDKPELTVGKQVFRLGDKVMQIKNRAEVSNGDTGYIRKIENSGDDWLMEVDFGEDRVVAYSDTESLGQLELAYAQTIHKSQGSEYASVLISIQHAHGRMLKRPLVYTAVTRAKRRVGIVGDLAALKSAIQTTDTERRSTQLAARIAAR